MQKKLEYSNGATIITMWVEMDTGCLVVENSHETVKIPYQDATEMIREITEDMNDFVFQERKKLPILKRMLS
jgi:hypothetical protein